MVENDHWPSIIKEEAFSNNYSKDGEVVKKKSQVTEIVVYLGVCTIRFITYREQNFLHSKKFGTYFSLIKKRHECTC
jgi:hypothetical protein